MPCSSYSPWVIILTAYEGLRNDSNSIIINNVKVNLSLCLINHHHGGVWKQWSYSVSYYYVWVCMDVSYHLHALVALSLGERTPCSY